MLHQSLGENVMAATLRMTRREALLTGAAFGVSALTPAWFAPAAAKAPLGGVSVPTHYRVKLGEFEVMSVLDSIWQTDGPHPIFGAEQKPEDVQALMRDNLLPEKRMELQFTPVIINTGSQIVVIDAGNGPTGKFAQGKLAKIAAAAGVAPEAVDVVVLTHGHPDHVEGLTEGGKPVFPNAKLAMSEKEFAFWDKTAFPAEVAPFQDIFKKNVSALKDRITFLKNEGEAAPGIRLLDAPGHTPGHVVVSVESADKRVLVLSDAVHHPIISFERPDWSFVFDGDKAVAAATRKRVLDMAATDKIATQGYHMPFPSFGYVEKKAGAFRWVQATYQLTL